MERDRLFSEVALALEAELVGCEQLTGGSSANVWRLDLRHEYAARSVVFRQHQPGELKDHDDGIAGMEYRLQRRLGGLDVPVARPLYLDEPNRFLVTEFVQGTASVEPANLASSIAQMANLLARIHGVTHDVLMDIALSPLEDPIERLATCLPSSPRGEHLGAQLASGELSMHANPSVLLHGDYWPGNVLWANGKIVALIDWEDACFGDPLADLAGARVELLCQYGERTMDDFTTRYLAAVPGLDLRSLPLWECYVSATALASMHLWGLDPAEVSRRRALTESFFDNATRQAL